MDELLASTLRFSIPLAFAAMGGVLSERAGVFNLALEGALLSGALGAALGAVALASPWGGVAVGLAAGLVVGLLLAILTVLLGVNQFVSGVAINLLAAGLTAFVARLFTDRLQGAAMPGLVPLLSSTWRETPIVGPFLASQDALALLAMGLPLGLTFLLFRTRSGLVIRAVGESPWAADVAGLSVARTRFAAVIGSCLLASLGGCHLVLAQVLVFSENMSAGKGFIALAAVILGRWSFWGAFAACILFGACEAGQLRLQFQNANVPYQLFVILPYALAIVTLVLFPRRDQVIVNSGTAFRRASR
jgi:ABC-type uncharacterized transport system permease subunit